MRRRTITSSSIIEYDIGADHGDVIEEIKRLDLLLEYAVQHGDEAEAERLREELKRLTESI